LKLEGPWGSFLAGRAEEIFSRGSSENDSLYAHRYGLGFPGNIDSVGPAVGLISFGIMAQFPTPGLVYQTPNLRGLRFSVGLYDPTALEKSTMPFASLGPKLSSRTMSPRHLSGCTYLLTGSTRSFIGTAGTTPSLHVASVTEVALRADRQHCALGSR
jgi:hypothetical protein